MQTDIWTICQLGHVHWGSAGAAGFLFRYRPETGDPLFLLQRRSSSVDYGNTWGVPGGAIREGESPEAAARREMLEEIGHLPTYQVAQIIVQDCGGSWRFYMIVADVDEQFVAFCAKETDATGWFTPREMQHLTLHPGLQKWLDTQVQESPPA